MIQPDTTDAVSAIGEVSEIIRSIDDCRESIASAVEQQHTNTNEMNRGVVDASGRGQSRSRATSAAGRGGLRPGRDGQHELRLLGLRVARRGDTFA